MPMIENFLKWSLLAVVALMVLSGVSSAVFAGVMGLMGDPTIILIVLVAFLGFALLLGLPVVGLALWAWRWWRMTAIQEQRAGEFVAPDAHGRLPVPASLLRSPEFAHRAMDVHTASYLANLSTFNYNPENTQHITGADGQTLTAAATNAPGTFWQLYQAGQLPSRGFLMGYSLDEDGQEVTTSWKELYSALIGGQSGSGKSTLIRSILAQSAMQGGRFVVIDPHYQAGEESLGASLQPLRSLMLCDVAADERQILDALGYVSAIGQRRLNGQDMDRTPIVLVVDETTALLQRSKTADALTNVLGKIAQETRKAGLYALCIGQNFHSDVMPTTVRDCFVSFISCRARKRVAATMADDNEFGKAAAELATGQAVWMTPAGDVHRLAFPNCTAADLELVAGALNVGKNTAGTKQPALQVVEASSAASSEPLADTYLERHFPKAGTDNGTGKQSAAELTTELEKDDRARRAIDMFLAGNSQNAILKELWGDPTGRAKMDASGEFNDILRSHLMKVGG
ncbi:MAG: type IV secretory system conjugative DNA transfer family protein [Caldilineaceae bacterium]